MEVAFLVVAPRNLIAQRAERHMRVCRMRPETVSVRYWAQPYANVCRFSRRDMIVGAGSLLIWSNIAGTLASSTTAEAAEPDLTESAMARPKRSPVEAKVTDKVRCK